MKLFEHCLLLEKVGAGFTEESLLPALNYGCWALKSEKLTYRELEVNRQERTYHRREGETVWNGTFAALNQLIAKLLWSLSGFIRMCFSHWFCFEVEYEVNREWTRAVRQSALHNSSFCRWGSLRLSDRRLHDPSLMALTLLMLWLYVPLTGSNHFVVLSIWKVIEKSMSWVVCAHGHGK